MEMSWLAPLWLAALVAGADSSVTVQWWRPLEAQHDWRPVQHWREDTRKLQGGEPGAAERRSFDGAAAVIIRSSSHVTSRYDTPERGSRDKLAQTWR